MTFFSFVAGANEREEKEEKKRKAQREARFASVSFSGGEWLQVESAGVGHDEDDARSELAS